MLKIFGAICWFLGIGGMIVAVTSLSNNSGRSLGPEWLYSRY